MNKENIDKNPVEDYWKKRIYVAKHGSFSDIRSLFKSEGSKNGETSQVDDAPKELPDWELFKTLRWRFKIAPQEDKDIDELLGMHPDSPCAKCKHSSARETCPGYAGNPMWGSLRCNCTARREKIAAEAKAEARRMWEENHGAWPTYEEFVAAMPGIETDDISESENIGREQYWEGEPCEYFEPIDEA